MTYNVFSGTLNPTQSINQLMWTKFQPDRTIPWLFMAVWNFRSHWP